jgi:hypothetical protein
MHKTLIILVFLIVTISTLSGQTAKVDLLEKALATINRNDKQLGIQPKTYWTRYPHNPKYKAPMFDDLFANPLKLYDYSRSIAETIQTDKQKTTLKKQPLLLSKVFYATGLANHINGFRGFIPAVAEPTESLSDFISRLNSFNSNNLLNKKQLRKEIAIIPQWLQPHLTRLLNGFAKAMEYQQLAVRNVDKQAINNLFSLRNYDQVQEPEFKEYYLFEDIMNKIDEQSLYFASELLVRSCEQFASVVDSLLETTPETNSFHVEIETSLGTIIISDSSDSDYSVESPLLVIDLGGNDTYKGGIAATSQQHPFSVLIDFNGNDHYTSNKETIFAQGAGIMGTAILIDLKGDDTYNAANNAQGFGLFGAGILYDETGTDTYKMENSGQGCGYFGIGLNVDVEGDDNFYLYGDGQGMGGAHGCGVLVNYLGTDKYIAETDPQKCSGRADYHSKDAINYNYAQGVGKGRRADLSDGHSWAGGFGGLFDFSGNDTYIAGNFSQAVGYWFGTGVLFDKEGDDTYESVYFSQASAAHFAMATMIDLSGNDKHLLKETSGAALSFGWDFCNTLFVDEKGDDEYNVQQFSIASSMIRSNTFFFELEGNDSYNVGSTKEFFGACDRKENYQSPEKSLYNFEANQHAIFIDASGNDNYRIENKNESSIHPLITNNSQWSLPDSSGFFNNYFIGIDAENGVIDCITNWGK